LSQEFGGGKMSEILMGDLWLKLSDKLIDSFIKITEARDKEKRIWRSLETVIGTKDFMRVE